jgi:hypothetical protein
MRENILYLEEVICDFVDKPPVEEDPEEEPIITGSEKVLDSDDEYESFPPIPGAVSSDGHGKH